MVLGNSSPAPALFFRRIVLLFLLFTSLRLFFYLYNFNYFPEYEFSVLTKAFLVGILSDAQAIAILFAPFILLSALYFFTSKRASKLERFFYFLPAVIVVLIALVEAAYYSFTFHRIDHHAWKLIADSPVLSLLLKYWYLVLVFVLFIFILKRLYGKTGTEKYQNPLLTFLILILWLLASTGGRQSPLMPSDLYAYLPANISMLATNPVQNTLFTIYLDKFRSRKLLEEKDYMPWQEAGNLYSIYHYPDSNRLKPYNIVIFVLESFSRSYLQPGHPNKAHTPFLDSLRAKSLVCTNAYANASISLGGLTAILGSIPPVTAASHMESPYANNFLDPFWTILQRHGYSTHFFYGSNDDHFGFRRLTSQLGFTNYYSEEDFPEKKGNRSPWGIYDGPFFRFAGDKLSHANTPFAAVIFNISSHFPYNIPKEYDHLPKGNLNSHKSIAYVDLCLKDFFNENREKPWFSSSIFVFVADHWSKEDNSVKGKGHERFEIPLMIYMPDGKVQGTYSKVADQLSVIPAIADIINLPDAFTAFGSSIFDDKPRYSYGLHTFPDVYQVISDSAVLLYSEKQEKTLQIYNYKNYRTTSEEDKKLLERQLQAFIQVHHNAMLENKLLPPR